jgi:transposase
VHTSDIQLPGAGRRRGRYSDEFKRQIMAACKQPGVSTAAVALANGLNANLLRRWISESQTHLLKPEPARQTKALAIETQTQFIPFQIQSGDAASANIQIELQRAGTTVRVQWPLFCAAECAAWMREFLK